jgi:hypothetical protein
VPFPAINDAKRPVVCARFGKPGHTNATHARRDVLDIETTTRIDGVWIHIRGETDLSPHEQLVAALAAVDLDGMQVMQPVPHTDLH